VQAQLSKNALQVLRARYLRRDPSGQVAETPDELSRRVARSVAQAEARSVDAATTGESLPR